MCKVADYHNFTNIDMSVSERRKFHVGDIWRNEAQCLECNEIIRSRNKHDCRKCSCGELTVDGGSWYIRRIGSNYKELSVMFNYIAKE